MSRSQPMDKEQLVESALDIVAERETAFGEACVAYYDAETAYRIRKAEEYLKAEGTEKAREAESIVASAHELTERNRTEAVMKLTYEKLKDAQQAVSARQTLLKASMDTNRAF